MNYNLQVDLKILFRYGTIYRDVVTMPKIDFCDATKKHHTNQPLANRLTSVFMTYIKASYPREGVRVSILCMHFSLQLEIILNCFHFHQAGYQYQKPNW